ncbi:hypothetical protein [Labrys sp. ZIDIC5]|uniref:hypothetical protein n=1 Tax=Labrys sedimenti TaxID=3106036 RepID=UPI002ACAC5C1|nr:hypothetical protein [Labrys sp. ZIDIC5]MDZ5452898.1 hypothetical protein [Labrys sp. ZIDIC5]
MNTNRRTAMTLLLTGAIATVGLPALAAIPDMSPAALTAEADSFSPAAWWPSRSPGRCRNG